MKVAVMQPYLFPYIGYFQLINAVDCFVVYNNIKYTKKGWINRNRILINGTDAFISFPLKKDSDFLNIDERYLANTWPKDRLHLLNKIYEAYRNAPFFEAVYPVIVQCINYEESNLFAFIFHSLKLLCNYMGIKTPMIISSELQINHTLKAENRVVEICKSLGAKTYINPIGGLELYNKEDFKSSGIELQFLKTADVNYKQFNTSFIPFLSIIDVLMFNSDKEVRKYLESYTLV